MDFFTFPWIIFDWPFFNFGNHLKSFRLISAERRRTVWFRNRTSMDQLQRPSNWKPQSPAPVIWVEKCGKVKTQNLTRVKILESVQKDCNLSITLGDNYFIGYGLHGDHPPLTLSLARVWYCNRKTVLFRNMKYIIKKIARVRAFQRYIFHINILMGSYQLVWYYNFLST